MFTNLLLSQITDQERMLVVARLKIKQGNNEIDFSRGQSKFDGITLWNTLFAQDIDPSADERYSADAGSFDKIKAIVIVEKVEMLTQLYEVMTESQKEEYIIMTSCGMRSTMFLAVKKMICVLAAQNNVLLEGRVFLAGDCDIDFMNMALSFSHVEEIAPAEKLFLSNVTIVGPTVEDSSEDNFALFNESYRAQVCKKMNKRSYRLAEKWLNDSNSPMWQYQSQEREDRLLGMFGTGQQFENEAYPKIQMANFLLSDIESRLVGADVHHIVEV